MNQPTNAPFSMVSLRRRENSGLSFISRNLSRSFFKDESNETPDEHVWKAVMWKNDQHIVNGIYFYVVKDDQYRQNLNWLNFLRPLIPKLLGGHVRIGSKPF